MRRFVQVLQTRPCLPAILVIGTIFCSGMPAATQYSTAGGSTVGDVTNQSTTAGSTVNGSVPSRPATNEVLHLTLRDAITQALRYNLGTIKSGRRCTHSSRSTAARNQRVVATD
jgi:hypothetical protein